MYTQLELEVLSAAPPLHRFMYTDLARVALLLPKRQPLSYTPPHAPPILAHAASAVGRSAKAALCVLPLQCFPGSLRHAADTPRARAVICYHTKHPYAPAQEPKSSTGRCLAVLGY